MSSEAHVVTGAFSFTGRFIAQELLARGKQVITLTRNPGAADPLQSRIRAVPFHFEDPAQLIRNLEGAAVLYNTYWVRFNHSRVTFDEAVANTEILLRAAEAAGVGRVVHISVSNPAADSPLAYFRGKAAVESMVMECRLPYAIIRPTLIFGDDDILINNIAWFLRRLPVFGIAGKGDYRVQPVSGVDVGRLAVEAGQKNENFVMDAAGPEIYRFDEFVRVIAKAIGRKSKIVHLPYPILVALCRVLDWIVKDVVLTPQEIQGLMRNLLVTHGPTTASGRFSEWLPAHADRLGRYYVSELERNYNPWKA